MQNPAVKVTDSTKPFYQSKTILLNALLAMMAVIESQMGLMKGVIEPQAYIVILALMAGFNVFLRAITSAPVALKKVKKPLPPEYEEHHYDG